MQPNPLANNKAMAASICRRPVDLFFVSVFASFAVIAVTMGKALCSALHCLWLLYADDSADSPADFVQSTYGAVLERETLEYGSWPPRPVVDAYVWWCQNYDSLLGHNPVW